MDNDTFKIMQKYDKQFREITDSNFCRLPGSPSLNELDGCYRNIFNKKSKLLNGCSNCIYACLKELARVYMNEVQTRTEPNSATNSKSTKKKVGRPKKVTINDNNNE